MLDDNKLIVLDDKGNEVEMEVLFTFDADENDPRFCGKSYVLFYNPKEETPTVLAYRYNSQNEQSGDLEPIPEENIEEWEMIEEVYNAFIEDEEEEE